MLPAVQWRSVREIAPSKCNLHTLAELQCGASSHSRWFIKYFWHAPPVRVWQSCLRLPHWLHFLYSKPVRDDSYQNSSAAATPLLWDQASFLASLQGLWLNKTSHWWFGLLLTRGSADVNAATSDSSATLWLILQLLCSPIGNQNF